MRRLFRTLILIFILFISWPFIVKQIEKTEFYPVFERIKSEIYAIKSDPNVSAAVDTLYNTFFKLTGSTENQKQENTQVEKPSLAIPSEQAISIHNIVLGAKKSDVEQKAGKAKRSTYNEYGTEWHTYHNNYQNFFMVAYNQKNEVVGLFTNQDLIASSKGIKLGTPKENVIEKLGKPLNQIRKGMTYFQFQKDRDYDVFLIDNSYVTIFYDKHNDNRVTSIQIISKQLEQDKKDFYTEGNKLLKEGFEFQLFDLTNADRVNHHLPVLKWDNQIKETARKHSIDMADNNYFSHTNQEGLSPFDRMSKDDIFFTVAGENLASGQFSSIFAHEGLMNSLGHRENILHPDFQYLGVGVAFNSKSQPYYTENFFSN